MKDKLRLAFVVQRYGLEIAGGAEYHCRLIAEMLRPHAEVDVFTTCALDYLEWKNHYPKGTEVVGGIPVHRATVRRTRNARVFASLSNLCFHETHTREEEEAWVRENGPYSPDLVRSVAAARGRIVGKPVPEGHLQIAVPGAVVTRRVQGKLYQARTVKPRA